MNLLKSPLRRTTAVVAGAFIGLAGAVAVAAPASAHHPELWGDASCADEGGWNIDWALKPVAPIDGRITEVKVWEDGQNVDNPLTKIVKGAELKVDTTIEDSQHVSSDVETVKVKVIATWVYPDKTLAFDTSGEHGDNDGDGNDDGDHDGDENGSGGNYGGHHKPKPIVASSDYEVTRPEGCKPDKPTPPTKPTTPPTEEPTEPGEPSLIVEADCDSLTIGLDNPEDGITIPLVFKTSKGETRELVVKPGETKTLTFSATPGFSLTVAVKGFEDDAQTIPYEQPEDCSGQGGGAEEPGLPVTGAAAGGIAGGAGLLLILGGALFFVARRRRIRFTA